MIYKAPTSIKNQESKSIEINLYNAIHCKLIRGKFKSTNKQSYISSPLGTSIIITFSKFYRRKNVFKITFPALHWEMQNTKTIKYM